MPSKHCLKWCVFGGVLHEQLYYMHKQLHQVFCPKACVLLEQTWQDHLPESGYSVRQGHLLKNGKE